MSGLFQKKERPHGELVRWKKELKLAPGYLILVLWIPFTLALLGWVLMASFSTTREVLSDKLLESGSHMENCVEAWVNLSVSTIFSNSLSYAVISYTLLILICAPVAHVLSRFDLVCNKLIQLFLAAPMGVPVIMVASSLFAVAVSLNILNSASASWTILIPPYIGINASYTTIFLATFSTNLSRVFEEAATINGCPPAKTFRLTISPMAQSGIMTVTIFNFINIWSEYFISLILGNSGEVRPVAVGLHSMISSMKYTGDWTGMFFAVVIVLPPTFILYIFLSEKITASVTRDGVEGWGEMGSMRE